MVESGSGKRGMVGAGGLWCVLALGKSGGKYAEGYSGCYVGVENVCCG
jgi:hypothetical protein